MSVLSDKLLEGFLSDIGMASSLAHEAGQGARSIQERGNAIEHLYRYTLVNASINSIASNLPLPLVPLLVEHGVGQLTQALAYIQQLPDEEKRVEAFLKLAPYLQQEDPKIFESVLEQIQRIEHKKHQAAAIAGLAKYFPKVLLEQALNIALAIKDEVTTDNAKLTAIMGLVPYLSESLLQRVMDTLDSTWSDYDAVPLLSTMAAHLSAPQIRQALEIANGSQLYFSSDRKSEAQAILLPYLAQKNAPMEAWVTAEEIYDEGWQAVARARMIPYLPEAWRIGAVAQLVEAVQRQGWVDYTNQTSPERYPVLWYPREGAVEMNFLNSYKPERLAELLTYSPDDLFQQGLDAVIDNWDTYYGAWVLPEMIKSLSDQRREEAVQRILTRMQGVSSNDYKFKNERRRALAFAELASLLPQSTMQQALNVVQEIEDIEDQIIALKPLIPCLPTSLRNEAIQLVLNIEPYLYMRLDTLAEWATYLDKATLQNILTEAKETPDAFRRAQLLAMLKFGLSEPLQSETEKEIREALEEISHESAERVATLIPYLTQVVTL